MRARAGKPAVFAHQSGPRKVVRQGRKPTPKPLAPNRIPGPAHKKRLPVPGSLLEFSRKKIVVI